MLSVEKHMALFLAVAQAWIDSIREGDLVRAKYYMIVLEKMSAERRVDRMTTELSRKMD